jgi:hypothetical protein
MRNSFGPDVNAMTFCRNRGLLRLWTPGQTPGSPEYSLDEEIDCIFTSQYQFFPWLQIRVLLDAKEKNQRRQLRHAQHYAGPKVMAQEDTPKKIATCASSIAPRR